jgi:4-amino-4-deoxy-L-arabinose transferase-like glycosyltransferase
VLDRRLLLAAIVLVAVAVRIPGLGDALSDDEGYSWLVASAPDPSAFLDRLAAYENTPPLFYLLLTPLPLDDEVWVRLPSFVAGVASVAVLYAVVRPLLGTRAALLSALALAVAPYHVSFSDHARGFVLAGLGLLLALWAAARLAQGGRRGWWWLYAAGAALALYTEYNAAVFLAAIVGALLLVGVPRRREALALGVLPAAAFLPWLHQLHRSLDALDETKVSPIYPEPGPRALRDVLVPLAFGEHGAAHSTGLRWLQLAAVLVVVVGGAVVMWRRAPRAAFWLLPAAGLFTLAAHAVIAPAGPDVFAQRYLTILIPVGAALVGAGVAMVPWRGAAAVAAALLAAAGVAVFVQRLDRELEPDLRKLEPVVGQRPVLTNSATVAFYLRDHHPLVDRPFGLLPGREPECPSCAIVDDSRVAGGVRPGPGRRVRVGPVVVRLR